MKRRKISLGLLFLSILTSCDPAKLLTIQNRTGKELTFRMIKNPDSKYYVPKSDSISYTLSAKGNGSEVIEIYGLGVWSKHDLKEFQNSIKEIQIISSSDTAIYKTEEELKSILPQKRRGIVNNYFKIKIE